MPPFPCLSQVPGVLPRVFYSKLTKSFPIVVFSWCENIALADEFFVPSFMSPWMCHKRLMPYARKASLKGKRIGDEIVKGYSRRLRSHSRQHRRFSDIEIKTFWNARDNCRKNPHLRNQNGQCCAGLTQNVKLVKPIFRDKYSSISLQIVTFIFLYICIWLQTSLASPRPLLKAKQHLVASKSDISEPAWTRKNDRATQQCCFLPLGSFVLP